MITAVACSIGINRARELTLSASIREITQARVHSNAGFYVAAAPAYLGTAFALEARRTVRAFDALLQTRKTYRRTVRDILIWLESIVFEGTCVTGDIRASK